MHETDTALLAAAKQEIGTGQAHAFEQILYKYERLIHHITRRYLRHAEDALDASQEAVIRIYRGLGQVVLPPEGTLKSWVCTVTARVCLDALRKRRIETVEMVDDLHIGQTTESAEESAAANERVREVAAAIDALPNDHRMVVILRDMQGLSYDALAETLGISVGTVKSRLSRALAAVKKRLDGGQ